MLLTLDSFIYTLRIMHEAVYNMSTIEDSNMFKDFFNVSLSLLSGCNQENYDLLRNFMVNNEIFNEDEAVLIYSYMVAGESPVVH